MTTQTLESKLQDHKRDPRLEGKEYRSYSEKLIADILEKYNLNYKYEEKTLVEDKHGMERLLHPDFHLKDYGILIEYFGMKGNPEYDKKTKQKMETYEKMGAKIISINPEDLWEKVDGKYHIKKDFEKYLITKIVEKIKESGGEDKSSKLQDFLMNVKSFPNYQYKSLSSAYA